jgi:peptidoglycan hydrolase-like protein with peptidoglycan-binding domain
MADLFVPLPMLPIRIEPGLARAAEDPFEWSTPTTVQGGALVTYPFDPAVQSVQVLLNTDGRNLKARIELLQGPNNDKQIVEFYSSDGMKRPLYVVIETPGTGNVVRIINQNPVEFPLTAYVGPYEVDARRAEN